MHCLRLPGPGASARTHALRSAPPAHSSIDKREIPRSSVVRGLTHETFYKQSSGNYAGGKELKEEMARVTATGTCGVDERVCLFLLHAAYVPG